MSNLVKTLFVAGAAYLAIDYYTKREKNKVTANAIKDAVATKPQNNAEKELVEAAEQDQLKASSNQEKPLDWQSADGWDDTTTISDGI